MKHLLKYTKKLLSNSSSEAEEAEREAIKFYESAQMKYFQSGDFARADQTIKFIYRMSADNEYAKKRNSCTTYASIANYSTDSATIIRNIILDNFSDTVFERFALFSIAKMEEYEFDKQPSVNHITNNDGRKIQTHLSLYDSRYFKKVDLLSHTSNVIIEVDEIFKKSDILFHENDKIIIFLGALFHDFGKSVIAAKKYGLYKEGMEEGKYKHEEISGELFLYFLAEFDEGKMRANVLLQEYIDRIYKIITSHHYNKYKIKEGDRHTHVVVEADRKARGKEKAILEVEEMKEA